MAGGADPEADGGFERAKARKSSSRLLYAAPQRRQTMKPSVLTVEDRRASDNQGLASRWSDMSYVIAAPEMMMSAATDLATIGSNVSAAHTAAAGSVGNDKTPTAS
jgi:hypothetical protein